MITQTNSILNLLFAKGLGNVKLGRVIQKAEELGIAIADVPSLDDAVLKAEFGLTDKLIDAISDAQAMADETTEVLAVAGIETLIRGVRPYPQHLITVLGDTAPIVLFAKGNLGVLERKAVGFCGSRNASDKGLAIAADAARQLAILDVNVVSGYAKGVDLTAHRNAIKNGGVTTIVLAEGIEHYRPKSEIRDFLNDANHLVLSEFWPRASWSGRGAMQRNRTIIGLSDAMVCIESGTTGGTHAAADFSLHLHVPLFVTEFANPPESAAGNKEFIDRGAFALRGGSDGHPNLSKLLAMLRSKTGTVANPVALAGVSQIENPPSAASSQDSLPPTTHELEPELPKNATPVKEAWGDYVGNDPNSLKYPKRLIEVDLPIARISAHARQEKSIRHGHISTLHIWWARRPLAACRAVICASLWPDPADPLCPPAFRDAAVKHIKAFAARAASGSLPNDDRPKLNEEQAELERGLSPESRARWEAIAKGTLTLDPNEPSDMGMLRFCLLDFIADFADWENCKLDAYLECAQGITHGSHIGLGTLPNDRPFVVDPFAGGASIPVESLRVGALAYASDINPIPVLLSKVLLQYSPQYGDELRKGVEKYGKQLYEEAKELIGDCYPLDDDGGKPIAYLWSRVIKCEGPSCGVEVPMLRSFWLSKNKNRPAALQLIFDKMERVIRFVVIVKQKGQWVEQDNKNRICNSPNLDGTVRRGSVTCPACGYTTPVSSVREQLRGRNGGAADARLAAVVRSFDGKRGRFFRVATQRDEQDMKRVATKLNNLAKIGIGGHSLIPDEPLPLMSGVFNAPIYGHNTWGSLFAQRQSLAMATFAKLVHDIDGILPASMPPGLKLAIKTCLAFAVDRQADHGCTGCTWNPSGPKVQHLFGRQAIPMNWDFAEANPFGDSVGDWLHSVECVQIAIANATKAATCGHVEQADAANHPLPDDSVDVMFTDPPYYNAIPYADLSDFLFVWLKRMLGNDYPDLFATQLSPKDSEICEMAGWDPKRYGHKTSNWFESQMTLAMDEGRRYVVPHGIAIIVFAHKTTDGWEAMLKSVIDAGWTITASWPIDTEMATRLRAMTSAALASSVHLVCRPREDGDGRKTSTIGDWRDVLSELPNRIHRWMPRLTAEGVVGADAIFACLGPALEIFSKYSRVEKSNGDAATLREYLEHVWAAVSTEALALIFKDADASGLEPDARLTAMWMWTIGGGNDDGGGRKEEGGKLKTSDGYTLEFDAARKIAQGLGVHLEQCTSLVEIKGDQAKLLAVSARTRYLFGTDASRSASGRSAKVKQRTLFDDLDDAEAVDAGWTQLKGPPPGSTTLDRVHQAMILFAANRGELLKRFLVDDGVGKEARFWKLADNLNKLYPTGTEERRWVEGVLARKRGLGL